MYKYGEIVNNAGLKEANMFLFGIIGDKSPLDRTDAVYVNGDKFANEMLELYNQGVRSFNISVNSIGGNVFQGYSPIAMVDLLTKNGADITITNVGVAYSMAGVFCACGTKGKRKAKPYASFMIHGPHIGGKVDPKNQGLARIRESLTDIMAVSTGMEREVVAELMTKETYYSADQAKAAGIIDQVVSSDKQVDLTNIVDDYAKMAACADLTRIKNQKTYKMDKINALLKLNPEASELAQVEAIEALAAKAAKAEILQNELGAEKNKVQTLEAKLAEAQKAEARVKATALIDQAEADGKLSKDSKADWIEDAIEDYAKIEARIKGLNVAPASINDSLKGGETKSKKELAKKYAEILASNPGELDTMEASEVEKMAAAYAEIEAKKVEIINA